MTKYLGLLGGGIVVAAIAFFLGAQYGVRRVSLAPEGADPMDYAFTVQAIKEHHVGKEISDKDLYYGAIQGMVSALHDPYSEYLPPDDAKLMSSSLEGEGFSGIGAQVGPKDGRMTVIAPMPGSPAEKAGVKAGDVIVKVDDKPVGEESLTQLVLRIRGPKGSKVKLEVWRDGEDDTRTIEITRDDIPEAPPVTWSLRESGGKKLMVVRIVEFNPKTRPLFLEAMGELIEQKVDGIVLDLRDNPGGLLDVARDVVCAWLPPGPMVIEEFRGQPPRTTDCSIPPPLFGLKTAVLVNGGSASASEITAGALQDYHAARVFGEKTFGKGCGQNIIPYDDGSSLRLTTFLWKTPKGRSIDKVGIAPDEVVKGAKHATAPTPAPEGTAPAVKADPQMDRATEWLVTGQ